MKKLLLATAAFALLAPAAQAEIKLDLGGYFKGYAGYSDQDTAGLRDFDIKRKSEIFFEGETTLDNGLTVGYHGELFQENSATGEDNLEASYLYMSGNWGRVNLGAENGAAYLLQVSAPSADANLDGADIDFSFFNAGGTYRQDYAAEGAFAANGGAFGTASTGGGVVANDGGQYADKITYLTPKFNGFQAGVSYSPEFDSKLIGDSSGGMQADDDAGNFEDLMEASVRYDGEFSGVGIHVGGGYAQADDEGGAADFDQWNAGLKLTFEGFSLGGAYIAEEVEAVGDLSTYVVGAGYDYGAYSFGATYFNSEDDVTADQLDRYTIGAGYTFGPGMKFNGSVALYDEELGAGGGNEATVVAIGTDIQF